MLVRTQAPEDDEFGLRKLCDTQTSFKSFCLTSSFDIGFCYIKLSLILNFIINHIPDKYFQQHHQSTTCLPLHSCTLYFHALIKFSEF